MKKAIYLSLSFLIVVSFSSYSQNKLKPHEGKVEVEGGEIWYKIMGSSSNIRFVFST